MYIFVALQVLPFQKITVGKISDGGGEGAPSIMLNLRKMDFFCYASPLFFTKIG